MADETIRKGSRRLFVQNMGPAYTGLGKNTTFDNREAEVVQLNYPNPERHLVRFDDGAEIIALERELHPLK